MIRRNKDHNTEKQKKEKEKEKKQKTNKSKGRLRRKSRTIITTHRAVAEQAEGTKDKSDA